MVLPSYPRLETSCRRFFSAAQNPGHFILPTAAGSRTTKSEVNASLEHNHVLRFLKIIWEGPSMLLPGRTPLVGFFLCTTGCLPLVLLRHLFCFGEHGLALGDSEGPLSGFFLGGHGPRLVFTWWALISLMVGSCFAVSSVEGHGRSVDLSVGLSCCAGILCGLYSVFSATIETHAVESNEIHHYSHSCSARNPSGGRPILSSRGSGRTIAGGTQVKSEGVCGK